MLHKERGHRRPDVRAFPFKGTNLMKMFPAIPVLSFAFSEMQSCVSLSKAGIHPEHSSAMNRLSSARSWLPSFLSSLCNKVRTMLSSVTY